MLHRKIKTLFTLLVAVLLLSSLTGCGSQIELGVNIEANWTTTEEEREYQRAWLKEWKRNNFSYIINSNFNSAPRNADFESMVRFVFSSGGWEVGETFIIDILHHNKTLYFPHQSGVLHLEGLYSAPFQQSDLERLIQALEDSDFRNWEEEYEGVIRNMEEEGGGSSWAIGIEFSDGTFMRRRSTHGNFFHLLPREQWFALADVIRELGQEVLQRHAEEQSQPEQTDGNDE